MNISELLLVLSIIFFFASLLLFFIWKIPDIFATLSGKTKSRDLQSLRELNRSGEALVAIAGSGTPGVKSLLSVPARASMAAGSAIPVTLEELKTSARAIAEMEALQEGMVAANTPPREDITFVPIPTPSLPGIASEEASEEQSWTASEEAEAGIPILPELPAPQEDKTGIFEDTDTTETSEVLETEEETGETGETGDSEIIEGADISEIAEAVDINYFDQAMTEDNLASISPELLDRFNKAQDEYYETHNISSENKTSFLVGYDEESEEAESGSEDKTGFIDEETSISDASSATSPDSEEDSGVSDIQVSHTTEINTTENTDLADSEDKTGFLEEPELEILSQEVSSEDETGILGDDIISSVMEESPLFSLEEGKNFYKTVSETNSGSSEYQSIYDRLRAERE